MNVCRVLIQPLGGQNTINVMLCYVFLKRKCFCIKYVWFCRFWKSSLPLEGLEGEAENLSIDGVQYEDKVDSVMSTGAVNVDATGVTGTGLDGETYTSEGSGLDVTGTGTKNSAGRIGSGSSGEDYTSEGSGMDVTVTGTKTSAGGMGSGSSGEEYTSKGSGMEVTRTSGKTFTATVKVDTRMSEESTEDMSETMFGRATSKVITTTAAMI